MSKYFDPSSPLTPSELFFLDIQDMELGRGDSRWSNDWIPLFGGRNLVHSLLITAFLANEQIGSLRLEMQEKRVFFGLGIRLIPFVSIIDSADIWPHNSLEYELHRIGASSNNERKTKIYEIVHQWLQRRGSPTMTAFETIMGYLCKRGYAKKVVRKELFIIHVNDYFPQEELMYKSADHDVQPIKDMLADFEDTRPDLWKTLLREIKAAFEARKM
ncbi:MAG: hypothetical protein ACXADB_04940 [Candidatus Hermodarchaeia archaeon]